MNPKIKFSHKYYKFPSAYSESLLSQIIVMDEIDISQAFRIYDTSYCDGVGKRGVYPLPKGKAILLLLIANEGKGWLWTTIRRWTPEKERYYKSMIGNVFDIEVNVNES